MKFYAVKKGRKPGVYRSWDEAKEQVDGFSEAEYKSFKNITDAIDYLGWQEKARQETLNRKDDTLENAIKKIRENSTKPVSKVSQKRITTNDNYFATTYTDGGSRNTGVHSGGHVKKTDKAAWAYLIEWDDQSVHGSGGEYGATNNKMEQTALINALKKLIELGFNEKHLLFVLDSKYVLNAINQHWLQGWKKRGWKRSGGPLKNVPEWKELDHLLQKFPDTTFEWTKGHANNRGNEFVDHELNRYMDNHM
ncbi:ribonuclease H family protein [Lactobacillus ultunensis]|uniref:Ribonuclease H n=1 Tax=Lactobacillus ultunensis DSM 16047 TaxID=525365 RepID=C2EQ37_9LACO|nr:ribonuclease H family protein [Lactobacillus ultunensis]EEJ71324.1 ribonuclease HI [Lactobacillus ultunensis DSM 16047]KRL81584.1 ribonuclease [Lactobacillus ultunensis DSM 16047]QQP28669.1 viroplasmin family protein [Lactobacillus ultunensis]